jgi:glycerate kinase
MLAAPDKFRGTATAVEAAEAMAEAAARSGWECDPAPIADGGEGLLECFGGPNRETAVTGPDGRPLVASWRLDGDRAVVEMARASGLAVTGPDHDALTATTRGTGELVAAALAAGARRVIVGAGGSATTDGGRGAVEVLRHHAPLDGARGYTVEVAADVRTAFVDAAAVFAPQKGADPGQVRQLTERLRRLAEQYRDEFGVAVAELPGAGAAGGLAGGLAALGAAIRSGFAVVAEHLGLAERVSAADLVLTGEGRLDATSGTGKAVGELLALAARHGRPGRVIAGQIGADAPPWMRRIAVDLSARFGPSGAARDPLGCIRTAIGELLAGWPGSGADRTS